MGRAALIVGAFALALAGCTTAGEATSDTTVSPTSSSTTAQAQIPTETTTSATASPSTTVPAPSTTTRDELLAATCDRHLGGNGLVDVAEPSWFLLGTNLYVVCVVETEHGPWEIEIGLDNNGAWTNDRLADLADPEFFPIEQQQAFNDADGLWAEPPKPRTCEHRNGGEICTQAEDPRRIHAQMILVCDGFRFETERHRTEDSEQWDADRLYSAHEDLNTWLFPMLCPASAV